MAKMVTRTFTSHNLTVLCVDLNTNKVINANVTLSSVKNDKDALKQVKTLIETETISVVKILNDEIVEEIRGMSEDEFFANSIPVTRPQSQMKKKA